MLVTLPSYTSCRIAMNAVSGALQAASNCNSIGPIMSTSCANGAVVHSKNDGGSVSLARGRLRPPPRFIYVLEPELPSSSLRAPSALNAHDWCIATGTGQVSLV